MSRFTLFNPTINSDQQAGGSRRLGEFEMDPLIKFNTDINWISRVSDLFGDVDSKLAASSGGPRSMFGSTGPGLRSPPGHPPPMSLASLSPTHQDIIHFDLASVKVI